MVYENVLKIYGPYQGKDNRLRIRLKFQDGTNKQMSYPRYIMEKYLDRYLSEDEQIDHIDGNPLNNDLSNLQIIPFIEHQKNDVLRNKDIIVNCKYCGKEFTISGDKIHYRNRIDKHQSGYFCSRQCSGKYGKEIQLGIKEHTIEDKVVPEKFKVKSAQEETPDVEVG